MRPQGEPETVSQAREMASVLHRPDIGGKSRPAAAMPQGWAVHRRSEWNDDDRQAGKMRSQDSVEQPVGAIPSSVRNADQDNRLTRMVLRDGAAGPDDLKRISQGVSGIARTRVHRSSDQRNRASREARRRKGSSGPKRQVQQCPVVTASLNRIRQLSRPRFGRRTTQRRETASRASVKSLDDQIRRSGGRQQCRPPFCVWSA